MIDSTKKRAVTILLHNEDGDILAVSRKNDLNDFGLPGGKVDGEETDEEAIIREVKEETGLEINNISPYFIREDDEYMCVTFIGNYSGNIITSEKGKVVWTDWDTIKKGSFGLYNTELEKYFNENHKYKPGTMIFNPDTSEGFLILMPVPFLEDSPIGYFVNATSSKFGYAYVKKTALDSIRMEIVEKESDIDRLEDISEDDGQYFACMSHFDTNHYYGKDDCFLYSYHLKKVVDVGKRYKHLIPDEDWKYVEDGLWNHDNIEDARKTWNDLKKAIGEKGANISFALTNSSGKTRSERADASYYEKIRKEKYGRFAKLCDRIANLEYSFKEKSSMLNKYKQEHDHFKKELFSEEYSSMWKYIEDLLFTV